MNPNDLIGHLSTSNVALLQKYAALVPNGLPIADIGTCAGKSAITMALVNSKSTILTVDPTPNPKVIDQITEAKVNNIVIYQMTSEEFGKKHCPTLGMCFIDGLHEYLGVKSDIELVASKVYVGGLVLFHDHNLYNNTVGKAIDEGNGVFYRLIEESPIVCPEHESTIYVAEKF